MNFVSQRHNRSVKLLLSDHIIKLPPFLTQTRFIGRKSPSMQLEDSAVVRGTGEGRRKSKYGHAPTLVWIYHLSGARRGVVVATMATGTTFRQVLNPSPLLCHPASLLNMERLLSLQMLLCAPYHTATE